MITAIAHSENAEGMIAELNAIYTKKAKTGGEQEASVRDIEQTDELRDEAILILQERGWQGE